MDRWVLPLKNDKALLSETKDIRLSIRNTIYYDEFDYFKSTQLQDEKFDLHDYLEFCLHSEFDSNCNIFKLNYIIEMAQQEFDEMAKYGGIILVTIKWDCWLPSWFMATDNCKPIYKFTRIDRNEKLNQTIHNSYETHLYFDEGQKRTLIRSQRIRIKVETSAILYDYDFYQFVTSLSAYIGVFLIMMIPFQLIIIYWLRKHYIQNIIIHQNNNDYKEIQQHISLV